MKEFVIVTDTTTDLPREYVEKHHLYMMSLPYTLEGTSYTWENPMPSKSFMIKCVPDHYRPPHSESRRSCYFV